MDYPIFKHILYEFHRPLSNPVLIFSIILFIILISSIFLKRIKIPEIIGLIISGIIIGPHGLNFLKKNSAVELFSTIGLLYIIFIAGLELDMNDFKKNRNKSIIFGFFTFIFPLLIGFPVCYYLLDYNLAASILISSMFSTHTLIAYPIIRKYGILKNRAVAIAVGGTILTDIAVLTILALTLESIRIALDPGFWIQFLISIFLFFIIVFYFIPKVAKWFFQKLESEKPSQYIFVLLVVFFSSFLAQFAGLEPIIGAFAAGLSLNRLIPRSSALMNRIEFIGNSLFIPFFLISVGMLVDVRVLLNGPAAWIIAGVLIIVSLSGKWIASLMIQQTLKFRDKERQLIFGLSSAHAATTLVVILVGFKAGILNESILNGTIILILVSCILASFVTENAARGIALESNRGLYDGEHKKQGANEQILIPISRMTNTDKLLDFAILIKDPESNKPITFLTVIPNSEALEVDSYQSERKFASTINMASASEVKINTVATIDINIQSAISRASKEMSASMLIMGWPKKPGIFEQLIRDKTETILNSSNKNIFVCHIDKPLVTNNRLVLICPPHTELEPGFELWMSKICKLSYELSMQIDCYCICKTEKNIKEHFKRNRLTPNIYFMHCSNWENLFMITKSIREEDLLIFISSRRGSIAYISLFDNLYVKFEKYFAKNNKIIIYPQENDGEDELA